MPCHAITHYALIMRPHNVTTCRAHAHHRVHTHGMSLMLMLVLISMLIVLMFVIGMMLMSGWQSHA